MSNAIFLGSFNPPHKGHYNCVNSVIESDQMKNLGIGKIHIIPCYQNPNKTKFQTSFMHRYKMCNMMFRDLIVEGLAVVDDIENEIKPTYTYELLNYLHSRNDKFIGNDFWWIITNETFGELFDNKWKESEHLLMTNKFIVLEENPNKDEWCHYYDIQVVHVPLINHYDIHSTDLRNHLNNGEFIEEFTNKKIQEYIHDNNLYKQ